MTMIGTIKLVRPLPHMAIIPAWLRRPPEPIPCRCGCGRSLDRRDRYGRIRWFLHGHNLRRWDGRGVFLETGG